MTDVSDAIPQSVEPYISPRSGLLRYPSNFHLAGKRYPLEEVAPEVAQRYPEGVYFDDQGFPDLRPYIAHIGGEPAVVKLKQLGQTSAADIRDANRAFGINAAAHGLAWFHLPNSTYLILVPEDLLRALVCSDGRSTNGALTVEAYQEWKRQQAAAAVDEGQGEN